ncbi:ABC transporter substrate-binding protein [Aurantimonas sp. A3-2-R12]|uniref:ABC transporter substrate-binding protein n=1 Tax=Aurantimonas sp. A3-2-R12 TaxID=3114362 RepID=UPI002E17A7D9|nr:ABC transporter substrate-binding protein [Aurantimonas sp. A3-2-R12]
MMHQTLSVAAFAAVLSAAALSASPSPAQSVPESADPIVLSKLDWTGQFVTTEVAAEILRRMGYNVEILQTTQVPMIEAMKEGQITASLENWYQALAPQYQAATEAGEIVKFGPTGLEGSEGWYYPAYVEAKCQGLPDWHALKDCADIFATPETAPKGRLLDYPAEWNPDAQNWIDALGLDVVALPSGGEGSTAAELRSATLREEPILLQWWEPTWVATEFDLKRVMLDEGAEGCTAAEQAGIETRKSFDCTGGTIEIAKLAWPGLEEKWPAAYRFLEAYQMTNTMQGPMAMAIETEDRKPEDVAKEWVDQNEAVWKTWVDAATQK